MELTKSLDAKKAKVGDPVEAKVTQDMKTSNGQILVPKDTRVFGRVTEAQPRSKDQKESQVGVAFDHAVIKDGGEIPMPASIQAIIAPAGSGDSSSAPAQGAATSVPEPSGGGMASGGPGGRAVGGAVPSQLPTPSANAEHPVDSSTGGNGRNPITGNTQGVVGFSNLKLTTGSGSPQGSVVSSEKSNVKLESGTWILLRVN